MTNGGADWNPEFSADGWILYNGELSGKTARYKVPIEGGDAVQVAGPYADMMQFSPDGKLIAFIPADGQNKVKRIGVVPADESAPARIFDLPRTAAPRRRQWSPDSLALTYIDRPGPSNILRLTIDGGQAVQLTHFKDQNISSFAWSRDGKRLAMARSITTNDVVLLRNFR
jgi:Tol biopolymer transport system component